MFLEGLGFLFEGLGLPLRTGTPRLVEVLLFLLFLGGGDREYVRLFFPTETSLSRTFFRGRMGDGERDGVYLLLLPSLRGGGDLDGEWEELDLLRAGALRLGGVMERCGLCLRVISRFGGGEGVRE